MKTLMLTMAALCAAAVAQATPSWQGATLSTGAYVAKDGETGDLAPSTANVTGYSAYFCTVAAAEKLFGGATDVAGVEAYLANNFAQGKADLEAGGSEINAWGYYSAGQYTFNSAAVKPDDSDIGYIAVAFYGNEAFRVFANDAYNTEEDHVVFDDEVAGTAGEWTVASVPEPTSGLMFLMGLTGLLLRRKATSRPESLT